MASGLLDTRLCQSTDCEFGELILLSGQVGNTLRYGLSRNSTDILGVDYVQPILCRHSVESGDHQQSSSQPVHGVLSAHSPVGNLDAD